MSDKTKPNVSVPKYLPLHIARATWSMKSGLEALQLSNWIDIDRNFVPELNIKAQRLKESYSDVVATLPGSHAGQQEILELLLAHLLEYFPEYYRLEGTKIENLKTGQVWEISDYEDVPIALAGQLVQEDLCLMQPTSEGHVLKAISSTFPLFWRVPDKIGLPLYKIHHPVPEFPEKLKHPLELYFERLRPDRPGTRIAWGIAPTPLLVIAWYQPTEGWEKAITAENAGEHLWLRTEHQTLRRLPKSGDILFTIRSFVDPISALKDYPTNRKNLATVIRQMPPETQTYRGMEPFLEPLLAYLEG